MLENYLDAELYDIIKNSFNFNDINEIRMRLNERIIISVGLKKYFLKNKKNEYVIVTNQMITNFLNKISEYSIYAYNDNIIDGYITLPKGVRVGLAGRVVREGDKIVTIKEFQSVNIRIPHFVINCSLPYIDYIFSNGEVYNTLIISSPGCGKTTFLRDILYQFSEKNISKNILIADERNEICGVTSGDSTLKISGFCDVYTNCTKEYAFNNGIRSMNPDVVVCDELDLSKDIKCVDRAINSGVSIIATIHAKDIEELKRKQEFKYLLDNRSFDRFIVLSKDEGLGTLSSIYDSKLNCIYCRSL